jgi:hypothetical protein
MKGESYIQDSKIVDISNALCYMNKMGKNCNRKSDFYKFKKKILTKAIKRKEAHKIGIHINKEDKQLFTLIHFGSNKFHLPSSPADCRHLSVLGTFNTNKVDQIEFKKVNNCKYLLNSYADKVYNK